MSEVAFWLVPVPYHLSSLKLFSSSMSKHGSSTICPKIMRKILLNFFCVRFHNWIRNLSSWLDFYVLVAMQSCLHQISTSEYFPLFFVYFFIDVFNYNWYNLQHFIMTHFKQLKLTCKRVVPKLLRQNTKLQNLPTAISIYTIYKQTISVDSYDWFYDLSSNTTLQTGTVNPST